MRTTLNKIRAHSPCCDGWEKLLRHLGKIAADDEPLLIETILDSNGLDDALWCLQAVDGQEREIRLYAVWCARRVQHLMPDPASVAVLDVSERYARGRATGEELEAARAAAWEAAKEVRAQRVSRAAEAAARDSADTAANTAEVAAAADWAALARGTAAAVENERTAQAEELRRICREIEAGRDPYPEEGGR